MYSVQCTLYTVHCIVYSVQCTVYSLQSTVYSIQCTVYSVQNKRIRRQEYNAVESLTALMAAERRDGAVLTSLIWCWQLKESTGADIRLRLATKEYLAVGKAEFYRRT